VETLGYKSVRKRTGEDRRDIGGCFELKEQICRRDSINAMAEARAYDPSMRAFALLFTLVPLNALAQKSLEFKIAVIAKEARGTVRAFPACFQARSLILISILTIIPRCSPCTNFRLRSQLCTWRTQEDCCPVSDLENLQMSHWIEVCGFCRQTSFRALAA
jgi:hypothetical protein